MNGTFPAPGPVGCIRLVGRFDFSAFRHFRNSYEPMLDDAKINEIRIELAEVVHMDSAALGMLLLLREKAEEHGKRVSLAHCSPGIRHILTVTNFNQLFELVD